MIQVGNFLTLLAALANLGLGLGIFVKGKKTTLNKWFSIFTFLTAAWVFSNFLFFIFPNLFIMKTQYALGALVTPLSLIWIYIFLDNKIDYIKSYSLLAFGCIMAIVAYANGLVISELNSFPDGSFDLKTGRLFDVYSLLFLFFYFLVIFALVKGYRHSSGLRKTQISYILIGALLFGIISMTIGFVLPFFGIVAVAPYDSQSSLFFVLFSTYAIVKHRLMDIRMVLRSSSVALVSFVSIILPAIIVKSIINNSFSITVKWVDYIVLIAAIAFFPSLKNYYSKIANKYFFTSLYDPQQVIAKLSDKLSNTLRLKDIFRYISSTIVKSFHCREIIIFNFNKKSRRYIVQYGRGSGKSRQKSFLEEPGFYTNVIKPNRIIIIDDLKEGSYLKYRKTIDFFRGYKVEILVPLKLKDKIIGLIALGYKESKDSYNDQDLGVLEIIGGQSAIAIDNALHYEEIKNFSKKLEKEVTDATKELRIANKKLKQLDVAKSEFVSIASHQLRTPLTIIKGYISMMLDGSFGRMSKILKESLTKVYISNERLIQLVENLLNISRIESGRLTFRYEVMQLEKIINSVVEELSSTAKQKGLKLKYNASKKLLPQIKIDSEKIRQVVLNLVDNAIKYTKSGYIDICLRQIDDDLFFCASDSGMGIANKDLLGLFDKFTRGADTSLVHTEGTGLGLYVAKQMIVAHKGKIWAESDGPGRGSKFCFTLPINLVKTKNNLAK